MLIFSHVNLFCPVVYPAIDQLPAEYVDMAIHLLDPKKIDFPTAARYISSESFWRRLCLERWPSPDIKPHGNSWKRLYCEKHLTSLIESYYPSTETSGDVDASLNLLLVHTQAAAPFVYSLDLHPLAPWPVDKLPGDSILGYLPNLHSLSLSPAPSIGLDFDSSLLLLSAPILQAICMHVSRSRTLVSLSLCNLSLSDSHVLLLARALASSSTITSLSLAHNVMSDNAITALCSALTTTYVLSQLDISDNEIGEEGARTLATYISSDACVLTSLDITLNPIGDEGAAAILRAAAQCPSLKRIRMVACGAAERAASAVAQALEGENGQGREIILSGNRDALSGTAGNNVIDAVSRPTATGYVRWQGTGIAIEDEEKGLQAIRERRIKERQQNRKMFQQGWDSMM